MERREGEYCRRKEIGGREGKEGSEYEQKRSQFWGVKRRRKRWKEEEGERRKIGGGGGREERERR